MPKGLPIAYIKKWGISKLAWSKFREGALTKGVPTRTASIQKYAKAALKKRLKSDRKMVKKRRRRRGGMTIPIAPVLGLGAGLVGPVQTAMGGNFDNAWKDALQNYTGYSAYDGKFHVELLQRGLAPLVIGLLVHKFVGGRPLNFNGMLARAKVPFIRI